MPDAGVWLDLETSDVNHQEPTPVGQDLSPGAAQLFLLS